MEGVTTDSIVRVLINRTFIFEKPHFLSRHEQKYNAILLLDCYFFKYCVKSTPIFILRVSTE